MRALALSAAIAYALLALPGTLTGTALAADARYVVRKGDSLSLIAVRFGSTVGALREANQVTGDVIRIGQRLTLPNVFADPGAAPDRWQDPAPARGSVLRPFGTYEERGVRLRRSGTEAACPVGSPLYSPAAGVVRHSGVVSGYGHLLIIEHGGHLATVLGPCDPGRMRVEAGDAVLAGDEIAFTGAPDTAGAEPFVHLELRHRDQAIAPDPLLP